MGKTPVNSTQSEDPAKSAGPPDIYLSTLGDFRRMKEEDILKTLKEYGGIFIILSRVRPIKITLAELQ